MTRKPEPVKTVRHFCKNCGTERDCEPIMFRGERYYHCQRCLMNADYKLGEEPETPQPERIYKQETLFETA